MYRLNLNYRWLLAASGISDLGDGIRYAALPLMAASLSNSPVVVSVLLFASGLPWLLFSLVSGAVVDRAHRRRLMVIVNLLRMNWDDWLVIEGDMHLADGRSWSFTDPCLTTWEAQSIGQWLLDVAEGIIAPAPFEDASRPDGMLWFTEPLLAFSVDALSQTTAQIRVHVGLEANPPWLEDHHFDVEFFVPLDVPRQELVGAAAEWTRELEPYPRR